MRSARARERTTAQVSEEKRDLGFGAGGWMEASIGMENSKCGGSAEETAIGVSRPGGHGGLFVRVFQARAERQETRTLREG
jgi:hypothetical protein